MAWNYARYIGRWWRRASRIPAADVRERALLRLGGDRNRTERRPPLDLVMDVWKAGGPRIDMLSPDITARAITRGLRQVQPAGPAVHTRDRSGSGAAARAFTPSDATEQSVVGIDSTAGRKRSDRHLRSAEQLAPLMADTGHGTMSAILLRSPDDRRRGSSWGTTPGGGVSEPAENAGRATTARARGGNSHCSGAGTVFRGCSGVTIGFSPNTPGPPHVGLATVEEGTFTNGRWVPGRVMAGDDDDEGQLCS